MMHPLPEIDSCESGARSDDDHSPEMLGLVILMVISFVAGGVAGFFIGHAV